ncbi:MAG: acetoacetate decarboxylase family protein [Dehalococcoidia bacterium]|nr:MAG: acetoacetate decarboxylase family protein [Dehalococcoidia bacterium]
MGLVKTWEWLGEHPVGNAEFYDAERLTVFFETKSETIGRLLPAPLKPTAVPVGFVFIANYPRTNLGIAYLESALFLQAEFNGEAGYYCLAMPVTNDMAMALGREVYGYPKKMGDIHLARAGEQVEGWTDRRGVRFLHVKARLTGRLNDESARQLVDEAFSPDRDSVTYNFKYFPSPDRSGFDYSPRLIRGVTRRHISRLEIGEADITLSSSEHDFWGDADVVGVLGAAYTIGDYTMLPGTVVAETDAAEFLPYAFMKYDALGSTASQGDRV